jgi:hypothetical protein
LVLAYDDMPLPLDDGEAFGEADEEALGAADAEPLGAPDAAALDMPEAEPLGADDVVTNCVGGGRVPVAD